MLQPYQQRVVKEQEDLQNKLDCLISFLDKDKPETMSKEEWDDLILQEESMDTYNEILKRRISRFK